MNLKTFRTLAGSALALALCLVLAVPAAAQMEMPRTSPHAEVTQKVGTTDVTIEYHRPGVKGRTIFGDLVPYGEVWRTGANNRTTISFSTPVTVGGTELDAGTYGLLTVPGEESWTVILSNVSEAWGAGGYDAADDAVRVTATPRSAQATEWMEFGFENLSHDSADVVLRWAEVEVPFTVEVDTRGMVAQGVMGTLGGAADFCANNDGCGGQAIPWATAVAEADPSFWSWRTVARLEATAGNFEAAAAAGDKALAAVADMDNAPPASYVDTMKEWVADWKSK